MGEAREVIIVKNDTISIIINSSMQQFPVTTKGEREENLIYLLTSALHTFLHYTLADIFVLFTAAPMRQPALKPNEFCRIEK